MTGEVTSDRLEKLREMLAARPDQSFTRYGIAMELKSLGRRDEAIASFLELIDLDPGYVMAYQHGAYLLRDAGRTGEARGLLERGIEVAGHAGNTRAHDEMLEALETL